MRMLKYVSINIRPNIGILEGQPILVVLVVDDQALQIYIQVGPTTAEYFSTMLDHPLQTII